VSLPVEPDYCVRCAHHRRDHFSGACVVGFDDRSEPPRISGCKCNDFLAASTSVTPPAVPRHRCYAFRPENTGVTSDDPNACDAEAECNVSCAPGRCAMDDAFAAERAPVPPVPASPKEPAR
jgi:hypothetical protein